MSTSVSIEAEAPAPDWIARFVDDIPTGVALFDRELRYVAANASWVKAFRLAAVPLAGQRHDDVDAAGGSQFGEL
jgi:PAS domain-containing protein